MFYSSLVEKEFSEAELGDVVLGPEDLYKEFLLRGYEYGRRFQGIRAMNNDGSAGLLRWDEEDRNWVAFLDSFLQTSIAGQPSS